MKRPAIPKEYFYELQPEYYESPRDKIAKLVDQIALAKVNACGRPTVYRPEYDEVVEMLHLIGTTVAVMCTIFNVSVAIYYEWCKRYPSFGASVMRGREIADAQVGKSLWQRATGYSHPAEHISIINDRVVKTPYIKHYPPDTSAAIYWLNNRGKGKWRTQQIFEHIMADEAKLDASRPPAITINVVPTKKSKLGG